MATRRLRFAILVGLFILLPAGLAYGNGISPVAAFFPGFFVMSPFLGVPATLVAALLERSFVSLSGVKRHALVYSIRANLISWFAGAVLLVFAGPIIFSTVSPLVLLYPVAIVALTIYLEGSYLNSVARRHGSRIQWGSIIAGNLLSSFALLFIGFTSVGWGEADPLLASRVAPYVSIALVGLSVVVLIYGLWPRRDKMGEALDDQREGEAELGEPGSVSADAHEHAHASVGMAPDLTADLKR
jgi:membrane protein implicated in regulation of membrane protease activity